MCALGVYLGILGLFLHHKKSPRLTKKLLELFLLKSLFRSRSVVCSFSKLSFTLSDSHLHSLSLSLSLSLSPPPLSLCLSLSLSPILSLHLSLSLSLPPFPLSLPLT